MRSRVLGTAAVLLLAATPGAARANVVSGFTFQPQSTTAGGHPSLASTLTLSYAQSGDSVRNVTLTLPPGLLASLTAVPDPCTSAQLSNQSCPPDSEIGTASGSFTMSPPLYNSFTASLYLMPAPSPDDLAGLGAVITAGPGTATATGTLSIAGPPSSSPRVVLRLAGIPQQVGPASIQINSLNMTIDGVTSSSEPFTRLPSSCGTATTNLSIDTYSGGTGAGSGSDSFTPTGCDALAFAPRLAASATRDQGDRGARVAVTISQAPGEAAPAGATITVPASLLSPNPAALSLLNTTATVGTATATSPLLSAPAIGSIYLTGQAATPQLSVQFPAPLGVTLTGSVNPSRNSVSFASLPDLPLTALAVSLNGGSKALFLAGCGSTTGMVAGRFTGQNGATANPGAAIALGGCPAGPPTVSGAAISGLSRGKPGVRLTLTAGVRAPGLAGFSLALPSGLKCQQASGISVSAPHTIRVRGGRLIVTLSPRANAVRLRLSGPALTESSSLRRRARLHRLRSLTLALTVRDAAGHLTRIAVTVKL